MNELLNEQVVEGAMTEVTDEVVTNEANKGLTLGKGILIATGVYLGYKLGKKVYCVARDKIKAHKEAKKKAALVDTINTSETEE